MSDLAVIDPGQELERAADPGEFVVQCLERGKTWLAEALQHGDLDALVNLKGYAETLRVATMQKQLGHDAELSAAELVRRAERSIGQAIRQGQEAGEIRRQGQSQVHESQGGDPILSPGEYVTEPQERRDIYSVTDGVTDDAFEAAVSEAKAEGNMSRANVVRKVKAKKPTTAERIAEAAKNNPVEPPRNLPIHERAEQIRTLAGKNLTSPQIADEIGVSPERVREIARRLEVEIPADAVFGGRFRKIDPNRIIESIVNGAEPDESVLAMVAYSALDRDRLDEWVSSLSASIRSLNTIKRNLQKELTRDQE